MFNINNFRQEINNHGVMKNNRYIVSFNPPKTLANERTDTLSLRCTNVQLPGVTFSTIDGPPRIGYGPIESNPYGVIFDDINLTFLLDAEAKLHRFFYDWSNSIVNYQSHGQTALKDALGPVSGMKSFEVGYKDDYCTDIIITVYNGQTYDSGISEKPILEYHAYRAFPKTLPQYEMAWENTNDVVKLPVSFAYTDFSVKYSNF